MNWNCPYCGRDQTITHSKFYSSEFPIQIRETRDDVIALRATVICCANSECLGYQLDVSLITGRYNDNTGNFYVHQPETIRKFRLLPESFAKTLPDYIPLALREDYLEACRVRDLSPKSAATLARRCLQGMIRDFCGISQPTLFKEIVALKDLADNHNAPKGVSIDSIEAIDHIRQIGNIGAHMERDISVIVDVDPEEAQVLIELLETLFEERYVERHKREERFARVKKIAGEKAALKKTQQAKT